MSKFDEGFEVGDIVYSHYKYKGYWRVIEIEEKFHNGTQYSSEIHLEFVMSLEGLVPKKKARTQTMSAYNLSKMNEEIILASRQADLNKWEKLLDIVKVKTQEEIEEEMLEKGISIPDPEILTFFGPPESLCVEGV